MFSVQWLEIPFFRELQHLFGREHNNNCILQKVKIQNQLNTFTLQKLPGLSPGTR